MNTSGTRIFKKSTVNGKLTLYVGKRLIYDHNTYVDPIEGVVLLNPDYVKKLNVYASLVGTIRFGRTEASLPSLVNQEEFYVSIKPVYRPNSACSHDLVSPSNRRESQQLISRLQERLMRKHGSNAYPFYFQLPTGLPASLKISGHSSHQSPFATLDYELTIYVASDPYDKPRKRNSVQMIIQKLSCVPERAGPQPTAELTKEFLTSTGHLRVEASLDKDKYYIGESVCVNVLVDNNSNKTIKRIKVSVQQHVKVQHATPIDYKFTVDEIHSEVGFPISPRQMGWCKVYRLCPSHVNSKTRLGLAVENYFGQANLASSTILIPQSDSISKLPDISVKYLVKIRLSIGFGVSDICLRLPLILAHRDPQIKDSPQTTTVDSRCRPVSRTEPTGSNHIRLDRSINKNHLNQIPGSPPDFQDSPCSVITTSCTPARTALNSLDVHANQPRIHSSALQIEPLVTTQPVNVLPDISNSGYHFPSTEAGSIANDDESLFADFARLRLQATQNI